MAVIMDVIAAATSQRLFTPIVVDRGRLAGSAFLIAPNAQYAAATPQMVPALERSALSMSTPLTSCQRLAREGCAHAELTRPSGGACQHQAGHVYARDQQHEANGRKQHQHPRPHVGPTIVSRSGCTLAERFLNQLGY